MQTILARRALIVGALALVLVAGLGGWWWARPSAAERQVVFTIPPGTAARLAAGQDVAVLPQTITLTLGRKDMLVIRNDDAEPVQIGPFKIAPGQRFEQQYYNRGTYDLVCSIHRGEQLRIVVE